MTFGTYSRAIFCFEYLLFLTIFITSCWLGFFLCFCFNMLVTGAGVAAYVCDSQCKPYHPLSFPSTISKHITPGGAKERHKGGVLYSFNKCWPTERPYFLLFHRNVLSAKKCPLQSNFRVREKALLSFKQMFFI